MFSLLHICITKSKDAPPTPRERIVMREPVFIWNGITYGVCFTDIGYCIARIDGTRERLCNTPDSVLEYTLDGERLRDIITKVTVISRNI